ncbi:pimeloyl-ACP methyl ester carboxylesterase [Geomicrobium halophilum]|uniref:Pimeloyl-ACP methyl ester carboxylesterase n=1 Tax=Geomicrobium halophilum TaxID=549000 RepID=A0A841PP25_9BACL|nr:alpha/beta hydrolase [Geomicrobium halophilum]MBB6450499.1 pimeloyl-ACP methyl ester carboxylesterase [Geomicrobium halophilum]
MFLFHAKDGTRLHYDKKGRGQAIYFFHPPGIGAAVFRHQEPLADHLKLVALNGRGHGASEVGFQPLTIELLAEDTYTLTQHENDDQVIVCGYSWGSLGALAFALRYPERTKGVALIGGFPFVDTWVLEHLFHLGIWASDHHWQPLMSYALSLSHTFNKTTRRRIAATINSVQAGVLKRWYEVGEKADYRDELPRLMAPLLLIYGEHDPYAQGYQNTFYSRVKKAAVKSVYIEGVGHQVPTWRSEELNAVLARFVKELND